MTKQLLFLFLFVSIKISYAQITITNADMPNAGDSIVLSTANNNSVTFPILADSNTAWDYSTLIPTLQMYDKYDSPTTFTSPFNLLFNSLNTSYGRDNYDLTSISIPIVQLTDAYDFFKESTSSLKQIGAGFTVNSAPLPFYYTSPDIVYNFPVNYMDTDSCDYKYGLPIPILGYYGQKGHRVNQINGWGNLITPFGTFQSLLVTSKIDAVDTIYIDTLSFGTNITRPTRYEFKWLANGMKAPVLQINATLNGSTLSATNIQYIDSLRSNVPHVGIAENSNSINFKTYPNPSSEQITVEYDLNKDSYTSIYISDVLGKKVKTVCNEMQTKGQFRKQINLNDLSPGTYIIMMFTANELKTQKISIVR
jgi:hypothetical protein